MPSGMLQGTRTSIQMTVTICRPWETENFMWQGWGTGFLGIFHNLRIWAPAMTVFTCISQQLLYDFLPETQRLTPTGPRALPLGAQLPALEAALPAVLRARFSFGCCVGAPPGPVESHRKGAVKKAYQTIYLLLCFNMTHVILSPYSLWSLLQNSDLNWRKQGKPLEHSCMT